MQRRYNLAHLILAGVVALVLTLLMVCVDAQARIAFMSDRDWNWEIYVMDNHGGNQRNLTNNPGDDKYPSWSPDGKRIAFSSDRNDRGRNRQIYVTDADGGNQRNLSNNDFDDEEPSWSPDGKQIVFVSDRQIYVMDADGENRLNLTNNRGHADRSPSWSPDGRRIVFATSRRDDAGNRQIYVMDADGENQRNLTINDTHDNNPSWSPNGKHIAFDSFANEVGGNRDIYVMDADGKNQRNLTNHPSDDYAPSWSPDGTRIVFMSDRDGPVPKGGGLPTFEIYVMDADGGNQQRLTNHPRHDGNPAWSPDGKRIAFTSYRDGHVHAIHGWPTEEIYVMDANGGNQQGLTNNLNNDWFPSWSPDGKRIVFSAERDGHFIADFEITSSEIYLMDADVGNQQRLTENRKNDWHPSWSPDGKHIAFSSDRKGDFVNFEIYVMDANGGNQQRLTENRGDDENPSWSSDGKRIAFYSRRDGNAEIYVMDADGGNQQNLTNHPRNDGSPAWFVPAFAVAPAGKKFTMWGRLKQVNR